MHNALQNVDLGISREVIPSQLAPRAWAHRPAAALSHGFTDCYALETKEAARPRKALNPDNRLFSALRTGFALGVYWAQPSRHDGSRGAALLVRGLEK